MSNYPIGSTAKVYYDGDENPRTLYWMVRNEPDWATSRIIEGEKAIAENAKLKERIAALERVAIKAAFYWYLPDNPESYDEVEEALINAGYPRPQAGDENGVYKELSHLQEKES